MIEISSPEIRFRGSDRQRTEGFVRRSNDHRDGPESITRNRPKFSSVCEIKSRIFLISQNSRISGKRGKTLKHFFRDLQQLVHQSIDFSGSASVSPPSLANVEALSGELIWNHFRDCVEELPTLQPSSSVSALLILTTLRLARFAKHGELSQGHSSMSRSRMPRALSS
jgi:hypothetical protein